MNANMDVVTYLSLDENKEPGMYITHLSDEHAGRVIPWNLSAGDIDGMTPHMASRYIPLVKDLLERLKQLAEEESR